MNVIKVFEAFSGYGSQSLSLEYQKIPHEVVAISEIDETANKVYQRLHKPTLNLGDILKIEEKEIPSHDLFTYSFPCQDISISGKQASLKKGSNTRSSLLWECERIIDFHRPNYLLMENVKNLLSPKHKPYFDKWCDILEKKGYTNYYKILNSSHFNIPQHRERIIMISILNNKKDFSFIEPSFKFNKIKNILENNVDKKYHVPKTTQAQFTENYKNNTTGIIQLGNTSVYKKSQAGRVCSIEGVFPTLCAGTHGYANGYISDGIIKDNKLINITYIRKFTPTECFRLMGLKDEDIQKILSLGLKDTPLYKLAGNSIVIPVLEYVFQHMFS